MADISVISSSAGSEGSPSAESSAPDSSSFSFGSIHDAAMAAFGNDTPDAPASTEQVEAPAAPVVGEPATDLAASTPAQVAQLTDDQLVEVTQDGQQVQMTWKEARAGIQRQADYTRKMQQVASERQAAAAERQASQQAIADRETLRTLLNSPEQLQQFIANQYPNLLQQAQQLAQAQVGVDPNDIATVGQVQAAQQAYAQNIAAMQQDMQQQLQEQLAQVTQTIEDRAETAKLAEGIHGTIAEINTAHPYLPKLIPDFEQVLRFNVLKLAPQTHAETLQAFKQVAEGMAETFKAEVAAQNKTTVITKQNLVKNNIMPPGGASVTPTPSNFKKVNPMTGKTEVDWSALRGAAEGYLGSK